MKTHAVELTTEQLMFLAENLIRAQLKYHSVVEEYSACICETKKEAAGYTKWHIKMLEDLNSVEAIKKYRAALDQAIQPLL